MLWVDTTVYVKRCCVIPDSSFFKNFCIIASIWCFSYIHSHRIKFVFAVYQDLTWSKSLMLGFIIHNALGHTEGITFWLKYVCTHTHIYIFVTQPQNFRSLYETEIQGYSQ